MADNFLVRYLHDERRLVVNFSNIPLQTETDSAYARVRRVSDFYNFYAWETNRGDLLAADFELKDSFFESEHSFKTLKSDISWLALESKCLGLKDINCGWLIYTSHAVWDNSGLDEDDDAK